MQYAEIKTLIADGRWDELIGKTEGQFLECKKTCYNLDERGQKRELAKDVSSFANSDGGFILIGIATKKEPTHSVDEIVKLCDFPQAYFDDSQYSKIIQEWIIPEIKGLNLRWMPHVEDKGFGVIEVPMQTEQAKPFVITKEEDAGGKLREILVGFTERKMDRSEPTKPSELVRWLRDGRNYQQTIESRLDQLLEQTRPLFAVNREAVAVKNKQEALTRIDEVVQSVGYADRPYYALAAYTVPGIELKSIFLQGSDSIRSKLETPFVLRYAGFSLETLDKARTLAGQSIEVRNGDRKIIRLYRDGMLLLLASAASDFLAWGKSIERINQLALIEVTYLFAVFYREVLKDMPQVPQTVQFLAKLSNMHQTGTGRRFHLTPYAVSYHPTGGKLAPDDNWLFPEILQNAADYNPGVVAYNIVKEIYLWFGFELDKIPYTENTNGILSISADKIANLPAF
jgi:hypothetical protein